MNKILELQDITRVFHLGSMISRLRITAVNRVSLHVGSAEIFGLAGESGCGKTTIARMILGFEEPTSGRIIYRGKDGKPVAPGQSGLLVLTKPWPAMLRTIYGDPDKYVEQYWSRFPNVYLTGDGARKDKDGYFWILGRVDDVINVAGHRLSTMEVESALVDHEAVAESACIGRNDDLKGQVIVAFVTLREKFLSSDELKNELKQHVGRKIGAIARPDDIFFTAELPKTRSGKIMRRLLRDVAEGRALGDTTTLADPAVVQSLKDRYGEESA